VFFGLDSSKEAIKKNNKAIIMEGELDVIAAFQEGVTNTVAIKGTALTEEQVNLLSRFTTNIALCLDGDSAGQEAMKRSLAVIEKKGLTTTAIVLPNGKDPDEAIKTDPVIFKKAVEHDIPVYDVLLDILVKKYSVNTAQGKKNIVDEFLPFLSYISNEIIKEHYLRLLSKSIDVSPEVLLKEMERLQKKEIITQEVFVPKYQERSREEVMEEYLVSLVVQYQNPHVLLAEIKNMITDYPWITPSLQKIFTNLDLFFARETFFSTKAFLAFLPQELVQSFDACYLLSIPAFQNNETYIQEVKKVANDLYVLGLKRQMRHITEQIHQYEKESNEEKMMDLQQQLTPLLEKLVKRGVK